MSLLITMQEMIEEGRERYGLNGEFVMSPVLYQLLIEELQTLNPSVRTIEHLEGIPITQNEQAPYDTVYLLPFKGLSY